MTCWRPVAKETVSRWQGREAWDLEAGHLFFGTARLSDLSSSPGKKSYFFPVCSQTILGLWSDTVCTPGLGRVCARAFRPMSVGTLISFVRALREISCIKTHKNIILSKRDQGSSDKSEVAGEKGYFVSNISEKKYSCRKVYEIL